MTEELLNSILLEQSSKLMIPLPLLKAIVKTESGGNQYAYRAEPQYRYLFNVAANEPFRQLTPAESSSEKAPADFPYISAISSRDTEWLGQQASWGSMQIMGAVAREYGFRGPFPELCGEKGIVYGCKHLAHLRDRFFAKYGWAGVAAAFNAGSPRVGSDGKFENQIYVDKIAAAGGFSPWVKP